MSVARVERAGGREEHIDNRPHPPPIMHIATKVTLILGAILLVVGGVGLVGGIGSVSDAGENQTYLTKVTEGTFAPNVNESWAISVYVIHPADCDTLDLSITDSNGNNVLGTCYLYDEYGYAAGEEEYYGVIDHDTSGMVYTVESNVEVSIRGAYCDEACVDAAVGGLGAALGGFGALCCAIPLLVLGLILAFVLDDPVQNVMMPAGQMPTGQVGYQAPVMGQAPVSQSMNQVPVMGQAPVGQVLNQAPMGQPVQQGYGQQMQQPGMAQGQMSPPLTQQPQQPQQAQPAQNPWDNVQPPQ